MQDPDLILLLDTLNKDDINARMVGGCIRNHLFSKDVNDIDIACINRDDFSWHRKSRRVPRFRLGHCRYLPDCSMFEPFFISV